MKDKAQICQRLKEEGADATLIEQYRHYEETGNIRGQYRLVCRFRREKNEALKEEREKLACLDYLIAQLEHEGDGRKAAPTCNDTSRASRTGNPRRAKRRIPPPP